MAHMIGQHVSVGREDELSLSQALSIIIKMKLSLFFWIDNKTSLIYIVKYFVCVRRDLEDSRAIVLHCSM